MIVLGLGYTDHDASVALVQDGRLVAAIANERLTRRKRDGRLWGGRQSNLSAAIAYCLGARNLKPADVDLVVWSHVDHASVEEIDVALDEDGGLFGAEGTICLPHHFAHACSAFYLSPHDEAAVFVADGAGGPIAPLLANCGGPEPAALGANLTGIWSRDGSTTPDTSLREQETFYRASTLAGWSVRRKHVGKWDGLGAAYGTASMVLFGDALDAGKTMGLAPYGQPKRGPVFFDTSRCGDLVTHWRSSSAVRAGLEAQIETARQAQASFTSPAMADYAATIQREVEEILLHYLRWFREDVQTEALCLAGGVALNCVANARIFRESGFTSVFVPPAPGDDGIAVGCALYGAALAGELRRPIPRPDTAYLGKAYLPTMANDPQQDGWRRVALEPGARLPYCAERLAAGDVIAWFHGSAEFGPRALGHRSFLADPRRPELRDRINREMKRREDFRPFAPIVLAEFANRYFDVVLPSTYMSFVGTVRPECREMLPAVTHLDGTARYQVLTADFDPRTYALIAEFQAITGLPILLNTSFNQAGEPLVESPSDAAACAQRAGAEVLVIDDEVFVPTSESLA